jgi:hypothetical protein
LKYVATARQAGGGGVGRLALDRVGRLLLRPVLRLAVALVPALVLVLTTRPVLVRVELPLFLPMGGSAQCWSEWNFHCSCRWAKE